MPSRGRSVSRSRTRPARKLRLKVEVYEHGTPNCSGEKGCVPSYLEPVGIGSGRWTPIALLAAVVGLQAADIGTVGALVVPLTQDLHIINLQVGLLVTVSTGVGALATLLAGPLADRTNRVRLQWFTLLLCSAAMTFSAMSPNYGWLLACRVVLGAGSRCRDLWSPR